MWSVRWGTPKLSRVQNVKISWYKHGFCMPVLSPRPSARMLDSSSDSWTFIHWESATEGPGGSSKKIYATGYYRRHRGHSSSTPNFKTWEKKGTGLPTPVRI